jgi:macrodomain Ter protein organizer (MatP/YcbG family)
VSNLKKHNKIITAILTDYYHDIGRQKLMQRQIEVLDYSDNACNITLNVEDKEKIDKKIASLKQKIGELKFKNCQIKVIIDNIREKSPDTYKLLELKFGKGFYNSKISQELSYNESTVWQRLSDICEHIYQCLDEETIKDAKNLPSSNPYTF